MPLATANRAHAAAFAVRASHRAAVEHGSGAVRRRRRLRALVIAAVLVLGGALLLVVPGLAGDGERQVRPASAGEPARRAFWPDSWWNTPLPRRAPSYDWGDEVLRYLRTAPESGRGCLVLAGAGDSPWGQPIYRARRSDRAYRVDVAGQHLPELQRLRIPRGAKPADNSDGSMTVYDAAKGYVVMLTDAHYDPSRASWTAGGATVTYLRSNGLDVRTGSSDDPRNRGKHRGNNGATAAVSWDEVHRGEIRHVLKVASGPELSDRYVFPMVGSDGDYTGDDPAVPPEGIRLRIKRSVALDKLALAPSALVIARALQRYGFYIGDSGGTTALKLENTVAEGRGQLWTIPSDALCGLPFTPQYWDVIRPGYDPSAQSGGG